MLFIFSFITLVRLSVTGPNRPQRSFPPLPYNTIFDTHSKIHTLSPSSPSPFLSFPLPLLPPSSPSVPPPLPPNLNQTH